MKTFANYVMKNILHNNSEITDWFNCTKIENYVSTPSTTRTNSPDIEHQEVENKNDKKEQLINKHRTQTQDGIEYMNGKLQWIFGKPVYVVNTLYYYYGIQIKIYYYLYDKFDVKIGFYDEEMDFVEFTL